jgi:hypothetical protein
MLQQPWEQQKPLLQSLPPSPRTRGWGMGRRSLNDVATALGAAEAAIAKSASVPAYAGMGFGAAQPRTLHLLRRPQVR